MKGKLRWFVITLITILFVTNCYIPTVYADDSSIESESGTWQIISIDENTEKIEFIDRESGEKSIALNYLNGSNGDLFVEI